MGPRALPDIKALDAQGLAAALSALGEPAYRAGQVARWLYARHVRSFDEMTDLSAALRETLAGRFALSYPEIAEVQTSADGTRKYLVRLFDGVGIECVGLPEGGRLTVCFSTQAGCSMGCAFCATGRSGLVRDLTAAEMFDQVALAGADAHARVTNAVAMGQGEPFANYDATLTGLRLLNSKDGLGIGARHLAVSTCGLPAGMARFAREPEQFTLAISLHSAVQTTRDRLMPGVRGIALPRLRAAIADYFAASGGRRPTLEYALIAGVNDTDGELSALIAFCDGLAVHVNLIPVNPVAEGLARPAADSVRRFAAGLARAGIEASVRRERGADIAAACGQLSQRQAR